MIHVLILAAVLPSKAAECVPARWGSTDPASLALVAESPINCLLVDDQKFTKEFADAARAKNIRVFRAAETGEGLVVREGEVVVARLTPRSKLAWDGAITGSTQGLWPGVKAEKAGKVEARPTGTAWIETNSGFLRFVRANVAEGTAVWLANRPPDNTVLGPQRYIQAIGDAALAGARWVISLDSDFQKRMLDGDAKALEGWKRINRALRFYEENRELWMQPEAGRLAVVQDPGSGALFSGSILDMIAAKNIPSEIVPTDRLMGMSLPDVKLLLNIDPAGLNDAQKEKVRSVARGGATVVNGPPGWKLDLPQDGSITIPENQVKQLDDAWREINGILGRRNFGVRLFNASSVLSSLRASADRKRVALHMVNYSDYPLESVTVEALGMYKSATLLTPQGRRKLDVFQGEEQTEITIEKMEEVAILILE